MHIFKVTNYLWYSFKLSHKNDQNRIKFWIKIDQFCKKIFVHVRFLSLMNYKASSLRQWITKRHIRSEASSHTRYLPFSRDRPVRMGILQLIKGPWVVSLLNTETNASRALVTRGVSSFNLKRGVKRDVKVRSIASILEKKK